MQFQYRLDLIFQNREQKLQAAQMIVNSLKELRKLIEQQIKKNLLASKDEDLEAKMRLS